MLLQNISGLSIALPVLLGVFTKDKCPFLKNLHYGLIGFGIIQILLYVLASKSIHNIWLINVSTILMCSYYIWLLARSLFKSLRKIVNIITISIITILSIVNTYQGWMSLNKANYIIPNTIIFILSIVTLFEILKEPEKKLWGNPILWVSIGTLLYFSSNSLIFLALDFGLAKNSEVLSQIYIGLHPIINITCNFLYTGAFISQWKTKN